MYDQDMKRRSPLVIFFAALVIAVSAFAFGHFAFPKTDKPSVTSPPSAGPPLFVITSCKVGRYSFPTEDGNGPNEYFPGEMVEVADNWPAVNTLEIDRLVIVFYDNGTEVGSILASQNGATGSSSGASAFVNALAPSPVFLTFDQSQTWTLPAGWTGSASSCTVERLTTSPQVPQGHVGQSG